MISLFSNLIIGKSEPHLYSRFNHDIAINNIWLNFFENNYFCDLNTRSWHVNTLYLYWTGSKQLFRNWKRKKVLEKFCYLLSWSPKCSASCFCLVENSDVPKKMQSRAICFKENISFGIWQRVPCQHVDWSFLLFNYLPYHEFPLLSQFNWSHKNTHFSK